MNNIPPTSIEATCLRPCAMCGRMTQYVDYIIETPLCSKDCSGQMYDNLYNFMNFSEEE